VARHERPVTARAVVALGVLDHQHGRRIAVHVSQGHDSQRARAQVGLKQKCRHRLHSFSAGAGRRNETIGRDCASSPESAREPPDKRTEHQPDFGGEWNVGGHAYEDAER
jgi:hypothetical protein